MGNFHYPLNFDLNKKNGLYQQHFVTKLCSFTNLRMLFLAVLNRFRSFFSGQSLVHLFFVACLLKHFVDFYPLVFTLPRLKATSENRSFS